MLLRLRNYFMRWISHTCVRYELQVKICSYHRWIWQFVCLKLIARLSLWSPNILLMMRINMELERVLLKWASWIFSFSFFERWVSTILLLIRPLRIFAHGAKDCVQFERKIVSNTAHGNPDLAGINYCRFNMLIFLRKNHRNGNLFRQRKQSEINSILSLLIVYPWYTRVGNPTISSKVLARDKRKWSLYLGPMSCNPIGRNHHNRQDLNLSQCN